MNTYMYIYIDTYTRIYICIGKAVCKTPLFSSRILETLLCITEVHSYSVPQIPLVWNGWAIIWVSNKIVVSDKESFKDWYSYKIYIHEHKHTYSHVDFRKFIRTHIQTSHLNFPAFKKSLACHYLLNPTKRKTMYWPGGLGSPRPFQFCIFRASYETTCFGSLVWFEALPDRERARARERERARESKRQRIQLCIWHILISKYVRIYIYIFSDNIYSWCEYICIHFREVPHVELSRVCGNVHNPKMEMEQKSRSPS